MTYELTVLTAGNRRISWETDHPQTAHRWFRFTVKHERTIDDGSRVLLVSLRRNGTEIKAKRISYL